jgi:hypothetical protein
MIGDHLAWKVGSGEKVRLGLDVILGYGEGYRLFDETINSLHYNDLFPLSQVSIEVSTSIWSQGWQTTESFVLEGN